MIKRLYILFVAALLSNTVEAWSVKSAFAIVIDQPHYRQLQPEIAAYKAILEKEGLKVFVISEERSAPEDIRNQLQQLYKNDKLEGAVFIGHIPVPMIRDAQHLTSTFKMPQDMDWVESSVPSDRFYDDFDLQFEFIKQDEQRELLYYYKLLPESAHKITMDIYSGRIKAPTASLEESISYIRYYLNKLIAERKKRNVLSNVLAFTAEGYNSNALNSWSSLILAYRTQFADMYKQPNQIRFMNFRNKEIIKPVLLKALENKDLDFAYLNGHGVWNEQILSANPEASSPQPSMQNVSRYVRQQMRKTAPEKQAERKRTLQEQLGLNDKWFESSFDPVSIIEDSLHDAEKVISIDDLRSSEINAKLVYLDACLTGSFQLDDYLAAHYPFGKGQNIASIANSIGVLQDLWANELIGLLQFGTRIGNILKYTAYLETHIFGDPAFYFSNKDEVSWNYNIAHNTSPGYWNRLLTNNHPDIQALALRKITECSTRDQAVSIIKEYFYNSQYETVRTECFLLLKKLRPADWHTIIINASKDNFEYLRRIAVYEMGEIGDPVFIIPIIELYFQDRHSNRTVFNAERFILFFDKAPVLEAIDKVTAGNLIFDKQAVEDLKEKVRKESFFDKAYLNLNKPETTVKQAAFAISIMRAYRFHQYLPEIITYIKANIDKEETIAATESLSWFDRSVKKEDIIGLCNEIQAAGNASDRLKYEAKRTCKILTQN
ncbi:MAG: hypothetical protein KIT80_11295 [Chitinophagaceae bacterium]|nr:hypothetical protein [Chitinophagaceae bacterium]MCW5927486.1 hypothetical protein [Chitinophagaceae bacterium]